MSEALERAAAIREALGGEHAWRGGVEEARRVVAEAHEALDALLAELGDMDVLALDDVCRRLRDALAKAAGQYGEPSPEQRNEWMALVEEADASLGAR